MDACRFLAGKFEVDLTSCHGHFHAKFFLEAHISERQIYVILTTNGGHKKTYFLRTAMFLELAEALLVVNMRAANFSTESEIISNV